MKVLLVTFSDNADHQDIVFSMHGELANNGIDAYAMGIVNPKIEIPPCGKIWLIDCPKRPGVCKKTFDIVTLFKLIRRIQQEHFDVIFFETLHVWNLPIMLLCHKKTRVYQMIHDVIPHSGDRGARLVDMMNRLVCKLASVIVICNQKYKSILSERYSVPEKKVKVINLWRSFPAYIAPTNTGRVLFFGRLNPYKGVDNLLKIVKMCPDIPFDVVGREDSSVADLVKELRDVEHVRLNNGYVSNREMEEAFIDADWIILPYNSATQSGVIIDAYRYSRPVIAFDVGAISEQVADGVSGYLITAADCQAFAECLRTVAKFDKESHERMCKDAYEYGTMKFSSSKATKRFLELIAD